MQNCEYAPLTKSSAVSLTRIHAPFSHAAPAFGPLLLSEKRSDAISKRGLLKLSDEAIGSIIEQTSLEEASRLKAVLQSWHDVGSSGPPEPSPASIPLSSSSREQVTSPKSNIGDMEALPSPDEAKRARRRKLQAESQKRSMLRAQLAASSRQPTQTEALQLAKRKPGRPREPVEGDAAKARLRELYRKSFARRRLRKQSAESLTGMSEGTSDERTFEAEQTQPMLSDLPDFPEAAPPSPGHDFKDDWLADYAVS